MHWQNQFMHFWYIFVSNIPYLLLSKRKHFAKHLVFPKTVGGCNSTSELSQRLGDRCFPKGVMVLETKLLGGGNSHIFYVHPYPWGNDPIWPIFFQMGWNHQLDYFKVFDFKEFFGDYCRICVVGDLFYSKYSGKATPQWITTCNPKQPFINWCLAISNHFLYKDVESSHWNNHL